MLSGIEPAEELENFKIPVVADLADLPGVGYDMMDHPEIPIVGLGNEDFLSTDNASNACTMVGLEIPVLRSGCNTEDHIWMAKQTLMLFPPERAMLSTAIDICSC